MRLTFSTNGVHEMIETPYDSSRQFPSAIEDVLKPVWVYRSGGEIQDHLVSRLTRPGQ